MASLVTAAQLANIYRVTDQAISLWVRAGMPVAKQGMRNKGKASLYDLEACVRWHVRENYERTALERARATLAVEQAESSRLKNEETRGDLVHLSVIAGVVKRALLVVRTNILAVATKLSPELASFGTPEEVKAALTLELEQCLEAIADLDLGDPSQPGGDEDLAAGDEAAAAAHDQPVGGHVSHRQSRGKRKAGAVAN